MLKKNILIVSILVAMIVGVITGALINNKYTSVFKEQEEKVATLQLPEKQHKVVIKAIEKQVKLAEKEASAPFSLLSDIFLRLIKMIIAPLVFTVLVVGVAKLGDFKTVGRMGIKTLVYFTCATMIALVLGLTIVNVFKPGEGTRLELPEAGADSGIKPNAQTAKNFISHIIPESVVDSMAHNEILPIVIFALFFGVAAASLGDKGKIIIDFLDAVSHAMFKVTNYVMKLAPLGIFGAITAVVIQQGPGILKTYAYLITCFYGGLLFFVTIVPDDPHFTVQTQLWATDGTTEATRMVYQEPGNSFGYAIDHLTLLGNKLLFTAPNGVDADGFSNDLELFAASMK